MAGENAGLQMGNLEKFGMNQGASVTSLGQIIDVLVPVLLLLGDPPIS
jgi:hypothetical protein